MGDDAQIIADLTRSLADVTARLAALEQQSADTAFDPQMDALINRLNDPNGPDDESLEIDEPKDVPVRFIEATGMQSSRDSDDIMALNVDTSSTPPCERLKASAGDGLTVDVSAGRYTRNGNVIDILTQAVAVLANNESIIYINFRSSTTVNESLQPAQVDLVSKTAAQEVFDDNEGRFYALARVITNASAITTFTLLHCGGDIDDHWHIPDADSDKASATKVSTIQLRTKDDAHKKEDQIFEADKAVLNSTYVDTLSSTSNTAYVCVLDKGNKQIRWIAGERDFESISPSGQLKVITNSAYSTSTGEFTNTFRRIRIRAGVIVSVGAEQTEVVFTAAVCAPSS